ncbi:hypothetical protein ElyMa_002801800 [Elysia marginata]|uniref:Chitin-binding type-2 domain-containing protein n=1 Tax=Elysia marginata TaxID=1093978 RepID=A0AAV4HSZ4_9GAST|nr:hypothetical protein ElyMa_002801800 [Elysia marginata]
MLKAFLVLKFHIKVTVLESCSTVFSFKTRFQLQQFSSSSQHCIKMKAVLCFALIFLASCTAQSSSEEDFCIDITVGRPCYDKPNGDHHICSFCEHGFFARCQDNDFRIIDCPTFEDGTGKCFRLTFDSVTKTCVRETPTCTRTRTNEINWA